MDATPDASARRATPPAGMVVGGQWPYARLRDHHGARVAQELARRLHEAMTARPVSANRLAHLSGVNRQTIANVVAGNVWPDLLTIANLETALDMDLWPGRAIPAGNLAANTHDHLAAPSDNAGTSK